MGNRGPTKVLWRVQWSLNATVSSIQFGGDTLIDIMRTHPMIMIGGILQPNRFFVPPEEFLSEVRER